MEDTLRPAKKKRKKRTIISLDAERAKRATPQAAVGDPATVINFRKAAKRVKAQRRRSKTSTRLPDAGLPDDATALLLEAMRHVRELSEQQKRLTRRSRITSDELSQCTELVGQVVRSMGQMSLRLSTLENEMSVVSSELTSALRANKRLKLQLERANNRK